MRNIKKVIVLMILLIADIYAMQDGNLSEFKDHLVAFKLLGLVETAHAYKTGPEDIGFGIVTKEEECHILRILINKQFSCYMTSTFRLPSDGQIHARKATAKERELVAKAIKHSGARFWGRKTDGDSLQLLESSK